MEELSTDEMDTSTMENTLLPEEPNVINPELDSSSSESESEDEVDIPIGQRTRSKTKKVRFRN